jgi:ketosteroid isomerase-like protein
VVGSPAVESRRAIPALAEHVRWDLVGEHVLEGRAAVVDAVRRSTEALAGVRTSFERFDVVDAGDRVVVDSLVRYVDHGSGTSLVSSCDVYEFTDGALTAIRSYAVELPA